MLACERPTKLHPCGRQGTPAGYTAHRHAGESACEQCKLAWAQKLLTSNPDRHITVEEQEGAKWLSRTVGWRVDTTLRSPREGWRSAAECLFYPVEWWFEEDSQVDAVKVCLDCVVREDCLLSLWADKLGVVGGVTMGERRARTD